MQLKAQNVRRYSHEFSVPFAREQACVWELRELPLYRELLSCGSCPWTYLVSHALIANIPHISRVYMYCVSMLLLLMSCRTASCHRHRCMPTHPVYVLIELPKALLTFHATGSQCKLSCGHKRNSMSCVVNRAYKRHTFLTSPGH